MGDLKDEIGNDRVKARPRISHHLEMTRQLLSLLRRFLDPCQCDKDLRDDKQRQRQREQLRPGKERIIDDENGQRPGAAERRDGDTFPIVGTPCGKKHGEQQKQEVVRPGIVGEIQQQQEPAGIQPVVNAALRVQRAIGRLPEQGNRVNTEGNDGN